MDTATMVKSGAAALKCRAEFAKDYPEVGMDDECHWTDNCKHHKLCAYLWEQLNKYGA